MATGICLRSGSTLSQLIKMKLILYSIGLFLILGFNQIFVSASLKGGDDDDDLRSQKKQLATDLEALNLKSSDLKSAKKYLDAIVEAVEKGSTTTKKSKIKELKQTVDQYSAKLDELTQKLDYIAPENQVQACQLVQAFLTEMNETSDLNENAPAVEDNFIIRLMALHDSHIAREYHDFFNSIHDLEAQNIPASDLLMYAESLIENFDRLFTEAVNHDIGDVLADPLENQYFFVPSSDWKNQLLASLEVGDKKASQKKKEKSV